MSDGDIERLTQMLKEKDFELSTLRKSFEEYAEREKEIRYCLRWFVTRRYYDPSMSFEEAIRRSKRVLGVKNDQE